MNETVWIRDEEAMARLESDKLAREAAAPKIVETRPRCIRQVHEIHVRTAKPGLMGFGAQPNFQGSLTECRLWAREKSAEWNLPVAEIPDKNPDLTSRIFESPGIYIATVEFDEFSTLPGGQRRVFRW